MSEPVIDAHVHVWDIGRAPLSWWSPDLGLPEPAGLSDLTAHASDCLDLAGAVVVQAGDTLTEAQWLLEHVAQGPVPTALVLQYDARPGAWAGMAQPILESAAGPVVRGIRLAVPSGPADLNEVPGVHELAEGLIATGRVLEVLIRPDQLPSVARFCRNHPDLTVVLCHLGLSTRPLPDSWWPGVDAVAAVPNSTAKLSGLVLGDERDERLPGILQHAFTGFGAERLMVGSDWPISSRFSTYAGVVSAMAASLPHISTAERQLLRAGTARQIYALSSGSSNVPAA